MTKSIFTIEYEQYIQNCEYNPEPIAICSYSDNNFNCKYCNKYHYINSDFTYEYIEDNRIKYENYKRTN